MTDSTSQLVLPGWLHNDYVCQNALTARWLPCLS